MNEKEFSAINRRQFIRRAACAAVGTVAMTSAIRDLRFMNAAIATQSVPTDYKALVCIFLAGGNDSNNMIIPTVTTEYNSYAAIRTPVLALPLGNLQNLIDNTTQNPYTDSAGHTFGLHPACPELAQLFYEGKLAVLNNVGTLVQPIHGRSDYLQTLTKKPPQLFSHADQVTQWQTSIPDQPPASGWGGRCADLLNAANTNNTLSLSVSIAGANTFEIGNVVSEYAVSTSGAIAMQGVTGNRLAALTNILGLPYPNMQSSAYAGVAAHSINTGTMLNSAITNTAASNYWTNNVGGTGFPQNIIVPNSGGTVNNSSLSLQLKMIARLIEAGYRAAGSPTNGFGMRRQIFFCQVGGYDLHSGQTGTTASPNNVIIGAHANLFAELSQSLMAFQRGMEQLDSTYPGSNISKSVTTFTSSDFGRTFPSNGVGSDHGWGSHHLILGGAVKGNKTYGIWPTLTVNGPDDTGTGRWIPTTATDQYFARIAAWFGVDTGTPGLSDGNILTVFPNLRRFETRSQTQDPSTLNLDFLKAP